MIVGCVNPGRGDHPFRHQKRAVDQKRGLFQERANDCAFIREISSQYNL